MARGTRYKVISDGVHVASLRYAEDAAAMVALYGKGTRVRFLHDVTVWREGKEEIEAGSSYDAAAAIMRERVAEYLTRLKSRAGKDT